ncbi:hypothetical protein [uncultured Sphingomonas sp.]|uniref:hypothetical protein n=1 Tax=uncultured Sphingomonas sp. TaxID=158754 RepID=UPI0025ECB3A7|nr:hypothetical protein [uncultured Sphingomonas sp.]
MRRTVVTIGALLFATAATAQAVEQGQYSTPLRTMLTAAAQGSCTEALMGEALLNACRQQLPQLAPTLKAAGEIRTIAFDKAEDADGQRYEKYTVTFANGKPAIWVIGALKDGKFEAVYSMGE